jgi:hypothetical protein
MSDVENPDNEKTRFSLIEVIDGFIEKINGIRKLLLGITISALILAPLAIGLTAYLITHPHFFFVLDEYDEFGIFLVSLLGIILTVSVVWFVLGIRQYIIIKSWNEKYSNYTKRKEQLDSEISSQFSLDKDQET